MKADKISAVTQNILAEENLVRTAEFSKKKEESDSLIKHD